MLLDRQRRNMAGCDQDLAAGGSYSAGTVAPCCLDGGGALDFFWVKKKHWCKPGVEKHG